ncbi:MAG: toprim domain-containing protein, partial [Ignavibacteria bacterium]
RVYNKSKTLYGLNFAKDHIRSHDSVLLVEGYMDVVSLAHAGIQNVVASSGTALTKAQVHLISRYTKNIFLIFDADLAGIKAAKRGFQIILEQELNIKVVSLPDGEDPDSYVRTKGAAEFEKQLQHSKSIIIFICDIYKNAGKFSTPEDKHDSIIEIIQYIASMPNKIKAALYVKELVDAYQLYEPDLRDELERARKEFSKSQFQKSSVVLPVRTRESQKEKEKRPRNVELELVNLFVKCDYKNKTYLIAVDYLVDNLFIDYITNDIVLKTVELLLDEWHNERKIDVAKLLSIIEDEEIKNILHAQASQKYEITKTDHLPADSILAIVENTPVDYLRLATDIINMLKLQSVNRKIRATLKDPKNHSEGLGYLEEKRKINDKNKQ